MKLAKLLVGTFPIHLAIASEISGSLSVVQLYFEKATVHKKAFVKNILLNLKTFSLGKLYLFLNEVNFTNKKPYKDFPQS